MTFDEPQGRILAVDLGDKRIGVALSDPFRMVAKAHTVFERTSRKADFARYNQLITEYGVTLLVMGLPTFLDGTDSDQTSWVRDYSAELAKNIPIPLTFQDEAGSTQHARASMVQRGMSKRKRQTSRDAVAAAFILQNYLEQDGYADDTGYAD